MNPHEKAPPVAAGEASKTHLIEDGTQSNHSKIIAFPHHRTFATRKWFPHRCRQWRRDRFLRPGAITPLPEDFIRGEVV